MKTTSRALKLLAGTATLLVCIGMLIPLGAFASNSGPKGYEAWNVLSVSAARRGTSSVKLYFWKKPGSDRHVTWKCKASTKKTRFYIDAPSGDSFRTKRVSFKQFRRYGGGKLMALNWVWKRSKSGVRYRYLKSIHSSKPEYTGYQ